MKTEIIEFKKFLKSESDPAPINNLPELDHQLPEMNELDLSNLKNFFDMSPEMAGSYILIVSVATITGFATWRGKKMIEYGDDPKHMYLAVKVFLISVAISAGVYCFINNPFFDYLF